MKKLIALVLIAMLLLSGCQTNGGQSVAADATEPTAVYDWMAGESPVTPQRMGLKRMGTNNTDYAITPNGVYFMYDLRRMEDYSFHVFNCGHVMLDFVQVNFVHEVQNLLANPWLLGRMINFNISGKPK